MTDPHDPHHQHEHHTADPAALEDPVHHDVAEHELEVEAESDEDADGADADDADTAADGDPLAGEGLVADDGDWDAVEADAAPTGDAQVDAAVTRLGEVRTMPTAGHVEVYEDVHRQLQDALADLDGS